MSRYELGDVASFKCHICDNTQKSKIESIQSGTSVIHSHYKSGISKCEKCGHNVYITIEAEYWGC